MSERCWMCDKPSKKKYEERQPKPENVWEHRHPLTWHLCDEHYEAVASGAPVVHYKPPTPDLQQLTTIVDRLIRAHHDGSPEWDYLEDQYQQLKGK